MILQSVKPTAPGHVAAPLNSLPVVTFPRPKMHREVSHAVEHASVTSQACVASSCGLRGKAHPAPDRVSLSLRHGWNQLGIRLPGATSLMRRQDGDSEAVSAGSSRYGSCTCHCCPRAGKEKRGFTFTRFFFFKILFLFTRHTQRERQRHRRREKQAPCKEPNVGLDPGSPGSGPGLKAVLNY